MLSAERALFLTYFVARTYQYGSGNDLYNFWKYVWEMVIANSVPYSGPDCISFFFVWFCFISAILSVGWQFIYFLVGYCTNFYKKLRFHLFNFPTKNHPFEWCNRSSRSDYWDWHSLYFRFFITTPTYMLTHPFVMRGDLKISFFILPIIR